MTGSTVVFADLMDGANVRMVESRGGKSFTSEAFKRLRVMGDIFRQELQRDETTKLGVLGFVDDTHASTTELLDDAVMRDGLPNQLRAWNHWRE
jgi:hypothetical protein